MLKRLDNLLKENKPNEAITTCMSELPYTCLLLSTVGMGCKYNKEILETINAPPKKTLKTIQEIVKISLHCNWTSSKNLTNLWRKMSINGIWENIEVVNENPDYYIIINSTT